MRSLSNCRNRSGNNVAKKYPSSADCSFTGEHLPKRSIGIPAVVAEEAIVGRKQRLERGHRHQEPRVRTNGWTPANVAEKRDIVRHVLDHIHQQHERSRTGQRHGVERRKQRHIRHREPAAQRIDLLVGEGVVDRVEMDLGISTRQRLAHERVAAADVEDGVSGTKRHVTADQIVGQRQPRPLPGMTHDRTRPRRPGFNEIHAFHDRLAPAASLRCCSCCTDPGAAARTRTSKSSAVRDSGETRRLRAVQVVAIAILLNETGSKSGGIVKVAIEHVRRRLTCRVHGRTRRK